MSDRPPSQSQVKAKFVGGAQEQYDSFKDLSIAALDMHSQNWKTKSYMFPPVYSYGRPEVSDHTIEEAKKNAQEQAESTAASQDSGPTFQKEKKVLKKKSQQQECSTAESVGSSSVSTIQKLHSQLDPTKAIFYAGLRVGDTAEHIIYDALEAVSHLESISPMVIINNLDLNRIKLSDKSSIFQNGDKLCGEYDFVIIGPKVGIVVIEVKNANKSKSASQLQSFDKVIDFLKEEYPTISLPAEVLVRKLVIFVNSTKSSHKPDSLTKSVKNDSLGNSMRIWDQDDIKNRTNHISKPAFYSKFFDFFHETGFSITKDMYESLAPTLVGFASFLTFKNSSSSVDLRLDLLKISETAVLTVDSCRMQSQNPEAVKAIPKLETVRNFNMVLLPTPDQQRALAEPSPNRQFIIGVAGTGKTVVLQQKALKMLKEGKKVLILTAPSYVDEFKKFLDINCCDCKINADYLIVDYWSKYSFWRSVKTEFLEEIYFLPSSLRHYNVGGKMDAILFLKNFVEYFHVKTVTFFSEFDGILIDDACDRVQVQVGDSWKDDSLSRFDNLCAAVISMVVFEMQHPSKTLWIAMDLVLPPHGYLLQAKVMNCLLLNSTDRIPEYPFTTVVLNQIMRNSENIIKFAYTMDVLLQLRLHPIMGHKIVGKTVTSLSPLLNSMYVGMDEKSKTLWIEVKKVLEQIQKDQIPLNFVCILLGGMWRKEAKNLLETFQKKFIECNIPTTSTETINTGNKAHKSNPYNRSKAAGAKRKSEALFLDYWYNVSSREWPIVIFCSITDKTTWEDRLPIQRYRACSRATAKLYVATVRYPSHNGASSSEEMSQDAEPITGPSTNWKPPLKRSNTVHSFVYTMIAWDLELWNVLKVTQVNSTTSALNMDWPNWKEASDQEIEESKKKTQKQKSSKSEPLGKGSTCQTEWKALQRKRQRQVGSTGESKGNSSGVTVLNTALKRSNSYSSHISLD